MFFDNIKLFSSMIILDSHTGRCFKRRLNVTYVRHNKMYIYPHLQCLRAAGFRLKHDAECAHQKIKKGVVLHFLPLI